MTTEDLPHKEREDTHKGAGTHKGRGREGDIPVAGRSPLGMEEDTIQRVGGG